MRRRALRAAPDPGPPADPHRRLRAEEDAPNDGPPRAMPGTPRERSTRSARSSTSCDGHCADVGRDSVDDRADDQLPDHHPRRPGRRPRRPTRRRWRTTATDDMGGVPMLLGRPASSPTGFGRTADLGFSTVIVRLPAPYDRETIERMRRGGRAPRGWLSVARAATPGRRSGRRRRWRQAGPRAAGAPRRSTDGRRQHRRRPRAPRAARHARPRHGHVHAGRHREPGAAAGASRARRSPPLRCSSDTARRRGSGSVTATSRRTSSRTARLRGGEPA